MESFTQSLIALVVGGFLGGLIKSLLDYRAQVFSQLWSKRLDAYEKLWAIMKLFPLWPKAQNVTYAKLFAMSEKMKDWYFDTGGIVMSEKTRAAYGDLQKEINEGILKNKQVDDAVVLPEEYDLVQRMGSALRAEMTKDLLSRKKLL